MKKILLIVLLASMLFGCNDDPLNSAGEAPYLISAAVDESSSNKVVATFNENVTTTAEGFSILVNSEMQTISEIEGSGTRFITFVLNSAINYDDVASIEYDASKGVAVNDNNVSLASFSAKSITNNISETELSVLISNIPPEAKQDTIWLIIRSNEDATTWPNDFMPATLNMTLSALPVTDLFDIIVYAASDASWRPDQDFGEGYYATLFGQSDKSQTLQVITWVKATTISGINMGYMNDINVEIENTTLENAYELNNNGLDYVEGKITVTDNELWYKFNAADGQLYHVKVNDNFYYPDDFSGVVMAVPCDQWGIELDSDSYAIFNQSADVTGEGKTVYLKVKKSSFGGLDGNFQIYVEQ